ncbi:hypothetical protein ACWOC1_13435 [Enterococcus quebecensis]|uniref:Polymerase n=1 Tax=Enterococcus quebecensis TaxID=903983 RepID=A0A1E5GPS7_9ENTE|nr:hypothetical protein [Enterococcus quebecensis]OEG14679.1 hypothetical protein BCR23_12665 [Enterococcus quebecensis]OJG73268.1 hypothetical protein RV12_GL000675 [Enterococcus quebecensis]
MSKEFHLKKALVLTMFSIYLLTFFLIQNSMLNLITNFSDFALEFKNFYLLVSILFIVFFNRYSMNQIVVLVGMFIPLFITRIVAGASPLLELLIIVSSLKCVSLKNIIKTIYVTQVLSFTVILLLFFMSVIPDRIVIRDGVTRTSLGFWHPNTVGLMLLCIFILSIFSENKFSRLLFKLILFNAISVTVYGLTNSRTSFILVLSVSILVLVQHFFKENNIIFLNTRWFTPSVLLLLLFLSYFASLLYSKGNSQLIELNALVSNRISLGSKFLNEYSLTLFGQKVEYNSLNYLVQEIIGFQYRVLDNVYLKYLLNFGLISTCLLVWYLYKISSVLKSNYLKAWNTYLFIFLIFGLMEQSAFSYGTNFFLFFGVILLNGKENEEFIK